MRKQSNQLHVAERNAWRKWLQKNHDKAKEVWLVYNKKHTGEPRIPYDHAVEEALCFGWIDSIVKKLDDAKYMQKFTPRKDDSSWSEANKRRVERLIRQGLMTEAGLALVAEAKRNGQWDRVTVRPASPEIPAEFRRALAANRKAGRFFESLAPSHKRQYTWWITSAKREDTRTRRIKEAVSVLSQGKKLGMK
jgi:uncharacterized protein YdeI (YjbR/CyaY-like superfamily)